MTKQEILTNIFNKLRFAGIVRTKKDFADGMDYNYSCLSSALNGVERYLTDRFFKRICKYYPVNPDYAKNGTGEILLAEETDMAGEQDIFQETDMNTACVDMERLMEELAQQRELTSRAQEQTEKALAQMDQLIEIIRKMTLGVEKQ